MVKFVVKVAVASVIFFYVQRSLSRMEEDAAKQKENQRKR